MFVCRHLRWSTEGSARSDSRGSLDESYALCTLALYSESESEVTIPNACGFLQYHKALNLRENSYRLAVYVRTAKSNGALLVVPVVPKDAPENIFPLHLRGDVKQYFGGEHPKIEGAMKSFLI